MHSKIIKSIYIYEEKLYIYIVNLYSSLQKLKFVFPENNKKNLLRICESISPFLWDITNFILSKYILLEYMDICIEYIL